MQSQKRLGENDSRAQSYFEGHEMQMDRKRRFIILSDHTDNYILVFDKSGKLLDYLGTRYPGDHGLRLHDEGGEAMLLHCQWNAHHTSPIKLEHV